MKAFSHARTWLLAIVVLALALGAMACGSDDDSDTSSAAADTATQAAAAPADTQATESAAPVEKETLTVALYPSTDYANLYAGIKAGIFEKHGLELDVTQVLTGTGLTAAITSGKSDLGTNSLTSMSTGIANGLPVKLISQSDVTPTEGYVEVLVKKDSDIQDFGDLAGKTVATINLQGSFELSVLNAVEKAGGDPSTVKALAMAPTDEPPALAAGRVDAIVLQDPFVAQAKADPQFRSLGNPFAEFDYPVTAGAFFSSDKVIAEKGEAFKRFQEALTEASEATAADPELARAVIPEYTELKPAAAKEIGLPIYSTELEESSVTKMLDQMKSYGWMKEVPAFGDIVWDGN